MPTPYTYYKNNTTNKSAIGYKRLKTASLMILTLLFTLPTPSSATVTKLNDNTVQMSKTDLKTLVTEIQTGNARADALADSLRAEREIFGAYEQSVERLIAAQEAERETAAAVMKQLQRQLNAPSLELYTGYSTENNWEGGIRLLWRLK